ncbi:hypothetical protein NVP1244A_199 [Vibrio phage 1.244.A._10N.261.54.C3]|nr:hypothetical protein NVP1244A_199 [Vibrio phage 1.244.A._10N.261.54.C3]AUR98827.1 hypothetical protein NVP1255O_199 [Vibrio phage 1.255.O._10N.286.45.F1]
MSNLTKEAQRIITPLINTLIANTDNVNLAATTVMANKLLKNVHGIGRRVELIAITDKAVKALQHDMSEDGKRLNFNVLYPVTLLEEIKKAAPERKERWKHFFTTRTQQLCTNGSIRDRPVVLIEKLADSATYQVQLHKTEEGLRVAGVICLYGSSLNGWFDKADVEVSSCDFSVNPSTHYMRNHTEYAVCSIPKTVV